MIWWLRFEKMPFQFWREIWIWVVVILLQLYVVVILWICSALTSVMFVSAWVKSRDSWVNSQQLISTDVEHHCNVCVAITLQCQCVLTVFLLYTDGVYSAAFALNCPYSSLLLGLCILEMFSDTKTIFWSDLTSWIQSKAAIKLSDISRLLFFCKR